MLFKPERSRKKAVIIIVQYLFNWIIAASAVMAEEVEIMIQRLRYSGKNYALTKALDCL